jgi:hypothetical protein
VKSLAVRHFLCNFHACYQNKEGGGEREMDIEELEDLAQRKGMAIVGTMLNNDEATRQQIAKNLGLEMIEPKSNSDKQE